MSDSDLEARLTNDCVAGLTPTLKAGVVLEETLVGLLLFTAMYLESEFLKSKDEVFVEAEELEKLDNGEMFLEAGLATFAAGTGAFAVFAVFAVFAASGPGVEVKLALCFDMAGVVELVGLEQRWTWHMRSYTQRYILVLVLVLCLHCTYIHIFLHICPP